MRACLKTSLLCPLLLALAGGCATKSLWQDGRFEACKEPANHLNLRVFESKPHDNFLVIYDEAAERSGTIHPRAYWLNENQARVDQHLRPRFSRANASRDLPAVAVLYDPIPAGMNLPPGLCAVVATNKLAFTLYRANRPIGSHNLPVYNDVRGLMEEIALTPVTVTVDLTIVGSVVAYWYAGGDNESPPPSGGGGPYD
jgi:hypothetical protein